MLEPSLIEIALRRERLLVIAGLAFVVLASWGYLLAGAGMQQEMGGMLMPMSSCGAWAPGHAFVVVAMWVAMMAAMMLPSAAPMVLFHATITRQREAGGAPAGTSSGAFVLGYLAYGSSSASSRPHCNTRSSALRCCLR